MTCVWSSRGLSGLFDSAVCLSDELCANKRQGRGMSWPDFRLHRILIGFLFSLKSVGGTSDNILPLSDKRTSRWRFNVKKGSNHRCIVLESTCQKNYEGNHDVNHSDPFNSKSKILLHIENKHVPLDRLKQLPIIPVSAHELCLMHITKTMNFWKPDRR